MLKFLLGANPIIKTCSLNRMGFPKYHMATIDDLFPEKDSYHFVKASEKMNITKVYGISTKRALTKQIYHTFMRKVMFDIVEEGGVFNFPLASGQLLIEEIPKEVAARKKAEGKLKDFSDIFALGRVYDMVYRFRKDNRCLKRRVIMSSIFYKRMVELANSGKTYFGNSKIW
jgi:hypothetical protein